jgi:hypothetical protein
MATIVSKRMTATVDGDVVVFLIGMRVNRWWRVGRWLPVALAMPRMLRELALRPEMGFLSGEAWFGRTTLMVQYWRSTEQLLAYAKDRNAAHLPAWRAFNKHVGTNGDVGIWHETYLVHAGEYENVYVNMPRFGLGLAGTMHEISGARTTAPARLGAATAA